MELYWVILDNGKSRRWLHCEDFEGTNTADESSVVLYSDKTTLSFEGSTARQFWNKLSLAMQAGKRIIRLQPDANEMDTVPKNPEEFSLVQE